MSEVLEPPVTHPVTAALDALQAALDDVVKQTVPGLDGELWMLSGPDLLDAAEVVHRATRGADAVLHGLVREIDARGAATGSGAHSTAGWLRSRLHIHPGAARRMVTTSRALHDDPSGALVHSPDPGRARRQAGPTDRGAAQRRCLAELLRRAAIAGGTPARHGSRASITVTMALETLERRLGAHAATLDWSGPISAATARRLACDAQLIPVVLGANGEPLDVGRASYPVTLAIWRALVARDGGCAFNGCGRPPE